MRTATYVDPESGHSMTLHLSSALQAPARIPVFDVHGNEMDMRLHTITVDEEY